MSFQVEGKVAVVTGGSSGIGLAAVEILVAEGAKVAWCGRDEERLNASKHYILEKFPHANIFTKACNVLQKKKFSNLPKRSNSIWAMWTCLLTMLDKAVFQILKIRKMKIG